MNLSLDQPTLIPKERGCNHHEFKKNKLQPPHIIVDKIWSQHKDFPQQFFLSTYNNVN